MSCIVNACFMATGQGHRVASLHAAALVRNQPAKLMALNFSTVEGSIARTLSACSMVATPPADVPVSKTCLASPRPMPISSRTSDASTRRPPVQCQTRWNCAWDVSVSSKREVYESRGGCSRL
jgi:hypothetical protein